VRAYAGRLLGREDVKELVDLTKRTHPTVVEELTPGVLSLGDVQRVLQSLLEERVAVRDLPRIFEALSVRGRTSTETEGLVEAARAGLGAAISAPYAADGTLHVITLDPLLEQALLESLRTGENGSFFALEAHQGELIATECRRLSDRAGALGRTAVVVCGGALRPALRRLVRAAAPDLAVLAYGELGNSVTVETVGVVDLVRAAAA
jgi:flagellar biosynthesis protein FlhA